MQTILAVDDEEENLLLVERTLSSEYRVVAVNSGNQALKFLGQETPDLILLDIKMPHMDGFEVLDKIRRNDEWADIPVIFLSSYTKIYSDDELMKSGVTDYIGKPFDVVAIKARIREAMNGIRQDVRKNKIRFESLDYKEVEGTKEIQSLTVPVIIDGIEVELSAEKIITIEENQNRTCNIVTKHMDLESNLSLQDLKDKLNDDFFKINRSVLINSKYIRNMSDEMVILENGKQFAIPRLNRKEISAQIVNVLSRKIK